MTKLHLLNKTNLNTFVDIPFRQWQFHELPSLKATQKDIWNIKTASNLERPTYVIVCFQTNCKDIASNNIALFDNLKMTNICLWLNLEVYPFENQNFDFEKKRYTESFQAYCDFQKNFLG